MPEIVVDNPNRFIIKYDNKYNNNFYYNYIFNYITVNRFIIAYDKLGAKYILFKSITNYIIKYNDILYIFKNIINRNNIINLILKINLLK